MGHISHTQSLFMAMKTGLTQWEGKEQKEKDLKEITAENK